MATQNFGRRSDDTVWTPASEPPEDGVRVAATHSGDAFQTETTGTFRDGRWELACAFMVLGGRALSFAPTHWRHLDAEKSA